MEISAKQMTDDPKEKNQTVIQQSNVKDVVFNVNFLLERYHGKEWPPSPRRFFLALVGALYQSSKFSIDYDEGEQALRFLESQPPPTLRFMDPTPCSKYQLYVPNNNLDSSILCKTGTSVKKPSELVTGKTMSPFMADKPIQYIWKINIKNSDEKKKVDFLCKLANKITHLGLGIDPVAINCQLINGLQTHDSDTYVPDGEGKDHTSEIPLPGLLDNAKKRYQDMLHRLNDGKFIKPSPIVKYKLQEYSKKASFGMRMIMFKMISYDDDHDSRIILESEINELIKILEIKKCEILSNAGVDSSKIKTTVFPSIGNEYADLLVRRAGFVIPKNTNSEISDILCNINRSIIKIHNKKWQLELLPKEDPIFKSYALQYRRWCSVTPIKLDNEKCTNRNNTINTILEIIKCEGIDLKTIKFVNFRKEPYWNKLQKISPDQKEFTGYAEFELDENVEGPFVLGQKQESGFGLFAPKQLPNVAYFTIMGMRPPIENAIEIGQIMRNATMSKFQEHLNNTKIPTYISGHDKQGKPLTDHRHAFWLPYDADVDGLIDHLAVFTKEGFGNLDQQVFDHITRLYNKSGMEFHLRFDGFYANSNISSCSLFDKSKRWRSVTPYFMPWHHKKHCGVDEQIKKEYDKGLDKVGLENKSDFITISKKEIDVRPFQTSRGTKKPISKIAHSLELKFSKSRRGPIAFGYSSHFGLGLFMPVHDE